MFTSSLDAMLFQRTEFVQIFRLFLCYSEWQLQKRWGGQWLLQMSQMFRNLRKALLGSVPRAIAPSFPASK